MNVTANTQNRNCNCRISEFTIFGIPAVTLENELIRVSILCGMGGTIYEYLHKASDTDFMLRTREGLSLLKGVDPSEKNFFKLFIGGWFEMFPNSGKGCIHDGSEFRMHGEVFYQPWKYNILINEPGEISVRLTTQTLQSSFLIEKTFNLKSCSPILELNEKITNTGSGPAQYLWGHHITLGEAFLNENCVLSLPGCEIVKNKEYDAPESRLAEEFKSEFPYLPGRNGGMVDISKIPPKGAGCSEMLFASRLMEGRFSVTDTKKGIGFEVKWDNKAYPNAWIWQEFNATGGYPFDKACYAISIEPQNTITPTLKAAAEKGDCGLLLPGESECSWLKAACIAMPDFDY